MQGNITPIYEFPSGEQLPGNAIYATDGNYYGVSWQEVVGGRSGTGGYIYRVTPSGSLTKLYTLPSGTFNTYASNFVPVIEATDGNFYGVTTGGGATGWGSVYRLTPGGQYATLYSFTEGPGAWPQALIQASDGNLYAASLGHRSGGQISRISTAGEYTVMRNMNSTGDGGQCECLIVQGSDGVIYGTAQGGGAGGGTVFALDAGLPKPAPQALRFAPAAGPAGTEVLSGATTFCVRLLNSTARRPPPSIVAGPITSGPRCPRAPPPARSPWRRRVARSPPRPRSRWSKGENDGLDTS